MAKKLTGVDERPGEAGIDDDKWHEISRFIADGNASFDKYEAMEDFHLVNACVDGWAADDILGMSGLSSKELSEKLDSMRHNLNETIYLGIGREILRRAIGRVWTDLADTGISLGQFTDFGVVRELWFQSFEDKRLAVLGTKIFNIILAIRYTNTSDKNEILKVLFERLYEDRKDITSILDGDFSSAASRVQVPHSHNEPNPPVIDEAPANETWADAKAGGSKETPAAFVKRVYSHRVGRGLTRAELQKDPGLYKALSSWLRKKGNELDFDLPTVSETIDAHVVGDAAGSQERLTERLREVEREASALRRRLKKLA